MVTITRYARDNGDDSEERLCADGHLARWRPVARQQLREVVARGSCGETGEDVAQVAERFLAMALTRNDHRIEDGRSLAGVGMANEEPVFLADARGRIAFSTRLLSSRVWP